MFTFSRGRLAHFQREGLHVCKEEVLQTGANLGGSGCISGIGAATIHGDPPPSLGATRTIFLRGRLGRADRHSPENDCSCQALDMRSEHGDFQGRNWSVFKVEIGQFSKENRHIFKGKTCTFSKGGPARLQRGNARLFNGKSGRTLVARRRMCRQRAAAAARWRGVSGFRGATASPKP
jgi:hypothetical protein